jgi:peptidoglycan/xylan/chitin deacetylase (PgdA/CDA1 family)
VSADRDADGRVSADRDAQRSARLLFGAELADDTLAAAALQAPAVLRATATATPPLAVRALQRVAMKAGLIGYSRHCAHVLDSTRRSLLGAAAAGAPRFLVRVDEFPHYRALDQPGRYGTERFARFHELMAAHGVPYLIAALPALAASPLNPAAGGGRPLDAGETAMLARLPADGVTLALHGFDHRTRRRHPSRHSEISGLGPSALRARLDAGEAVLAALGAPRPRVFVPPFNRFDAEQYPLLAKRYDVVCGGPETVRSLGFARTPQWRGEAVYLPAYPPLYGLAATVLPGARRLIDERRALWVPVVLHWGPEADRGFEDLRRLAELLAPHAARWDDFLAAVEASR